VTRTDRDPDPLQDIDGETLAFTVLDHTRTGPRDFIDKERVPDFEGDAATLEKVLEAGCP